MFASKLFKKVLAFVVSISMVLGLFVVLSKSQNPAQAATKLGDISFFRPGLTQESFKNTSDLFAQAVKKAIDTYQKNYGGKIKLVYSDWNNWDTKIITRMAAGDPIDVVFGGSGNFPRFYTKGYLQPINNYVDLKAPYLNLRAMDQIFKYEGKYYLASQYGSNHFWVVLYNKDLMLEEGIDESEMPLALYKKGKWNWDTFVALAKKLTADTNGDGKVDRYGVGCWYPQIFVYSNGATYVTVDKKGNAKLNFDDPRVQKGLNIAQKGIKEGWMITDWNTASTGLAQRKIAMYIERWYNYDDQKFNQKVEDEIEVAPIPLGPDNKSKLYPFECDGYGISKGARNPKGAGKFINILLESIQKYCDDPGIKRRPKYLQDFHTQLAKYSFYPGSPDSVLGNLVWDINGALFNTASVSSALAGLKPQAQQAVAEANEKPEKPVFRPFKPFTIDFENGKMDMFTILDTTKKSVKLSIVSGKEAIKGKSLKVACDSKKDGEWIDALYTLPSKVKIYGWHDYKVSFDVKLLKAPPKPGDTYIYAQIINSNKPGYKSYGWITFKLDKANTVYHVEGTIAGIPDNSTTMGLKIGIHWGADFVIDNIKVEEVTQ